ncbi:MAG: LysM domain-containing protein [Bacilli bacterium]|nr:LysM domain-containing protein [Bacilli bacterium]
MRAIGEYKVNGTFNDEAVNLKLTAYRDNIKKSKDKGLKASIITGALTLVMMTSLAGCKMEPKAAVLEQTQIEQVMQLEQTGNIHYTIKRGDTLEEIANKYIGFSKLDAEVEKICRNNNIKKANEIYAGQDINLDVPISKLDIFGYTYKLGETSDLETKSHFITEAFEQAESNLDPNNIMFWRERQYIIGSSSKCPHEIAAPDELPLLVQIFKEVDNLETMQNDQIGFYNEEDIKRQEDITNYCLTEVLDKAVSRTEKLTGKKYGKDYILEPPIKVIPLELGMTR